MMCSPNGGLTICSTFSFMNILKSNINSHNTVEYIKVLYSLTKPVIIGNNMYNVRNDSVQCVQRDGCNSMNGR